MIFDNNIFSAGLPFNLAQGNVAISHKVRGQRSEVRGQRSEVRGQKGELSLDNS